MTQSEALFLTIVIETLSYIGFRRFIGRKITWPRVLAANLISHPMAWTLSLYLSKGEFETEFYSFFIFLGVELLVILIERFILGSWVLSFFLNTLSAFLGLFILKGLFS